MRYLVLSDIHANLEALEAVLDAARALPHDRVLVLGDLVGYGADPNAVVDRVRGRVPTRESALGWMPRYQDIDWRGLEFSEAAFEQLQAVDAANWRREVMEHEELFLQLHSHLPKEMVYERELLICRL